MKTNGLQAYLEYEMVKKRTTRANPLRKALTEAQTRIKILTDACEHYFDVGKGIDAPCRRCQLPYLDPIHKDERTLNHAPS